MSRSPRCSELLATTVLLAVLCCAVAVPSVSDSEWGAFKARYGKSYPTAAADTHRRAVYAQSLAAIEEYNARAASYGQDVAFGVNQYADMTPDEFKQRVLLPKHAGEVDPCFSDTASRVGDGADWTLPDALPEDFDWRSKGAVTAVKNQGSVGTCWAFSTTGNIEGQYVLTGQGKLTSFSEEYLVDCDGTNCGVFGGWPCRAYTYLQQSGGIPTEASYPYCCGNGSCYPCSAKGFNETFCGPGPEYCNSTQNAHCPNAELVGHINGWQPVSQNETVIKGVLAKVGPLSTLMDATGLTFYKSGIWNPTGWFACNSNGQGLDHAVLIVGWGVQNGTKYWTVKNSWGESFGEQGYFKIIRGEHRCGINAMVTTATMASAQ